ncbi:unnamed protein product, partial [Mesorhabditis spiculigera]
MLHYSAKGRLGTLKLLQPIAKSAWILSEGAIYYDQNALLGSGNFDAVYKGIFHAPEEYGAVMEAPPVMVILEYCSGGSLDTHLCAHPKIEAAELIIYARDMSKGVVHIHEKGFLHPFGTLIYELMHQGEQPWLDLVPKAISQAIRRGEMPELPPDTPTEVVKLLKNHIWVSDPSKRSSMEKLLDRLDIIHQRLGAPTHWALPRHHDEEEEEEQADDEDVPEAQEVKPDPLARRREQQPKEGGKSKEDSKPEKGEKDVPKGEKQEGEGEPEEDALKKRIQTCYICDEVTECGRVRKIEPLCGHCARKIRRSYEHTDINARACYWGCERVLEYRRHRHFEEKFFKVMLGSICSHHLIDFLEEDLRPSTEGDD